MNTKESKNFGYEKKDLPQSFANTGYLLAGAGLLLVIVSFLFDHTRASFNSVMLFMFAASIGVGSLFLFALEYVFGSVWSVPFRRVTEFYAAIVFVLPILALPALFNLHDLFHWTHTEVVQNDKILLDKSPYLNTTFFIIRLAVFSMIWIGFYSVLSKNSRKQDVTKDQDLTRKNIKIASFFIPVFAITITFTAIDWIMSMEPHWFSTIFGVYYFSGTVLAALALITITAVKLDQKGYLVKKLTQDHFYSFGALLFAFTNFWAYIAFSQFLLIWYANLPEETFWFLMRWEGDWMYVSIGLILLRFVIPYALLLTQPSKMRPKQLILASVVILVSHLYDLYWLVMPTFSGEEVVFSWTELGFPILAFGIFFILFNLKAKKENLVPIGDPKLKRGIDFRL